MQSATRSIIIICWLKSVKYASSINIRLFLLPVPVIYATASLILKIYCTTSYCLPLNMQPFSILILKSCCMLIVPYLARIRSASQESPAFFPSFALSAYAIILNPRLVYYFVNVFRYALGTINCDQKTQSVSTAYTALAVVAVWPACISQTSLSAVSTRSSTSSRLSACRRCSLLLTILRENIVSRCRISTRPTTTLRYCLVDCLIKLVNWVESLYCLLVVVDYSS